MVLYKGEDEKIMCPKYNIEDLLLYFINKDDSTQLDSNLT